MPAGWPMCYDWACLPAGYISPKAERAVRDVWRTRSHVVRQQTANVRSLQNIIVRHTGVRLSAKRIDALTLEESERLLPEPDHVLAVTSNLAVLHCLGPQITTLEKLVQTRLQHTSASAQLQIVEGLGTIVAQTIVRKTGELRRLSTVGHDASSCRCVTSTTISHGKRKGQGNVKNGNPYLAWAFVEAAQCAIRFSPTVHRLYQRKHATSSGMVARKAVAHQLSRACYDIIRDLVPFEAQKACG